jgi:nucleoid-associated protein YgaU
VSLTHLVIEVLEREAQDTARKVPERITVQLNPTEVTFSKGSQVAEIAIPGLDSPILQFIRGQTERLSLEFLFDTTDSGMVEGARPVTDLTEPLHQLVKVQPKTHASPVVRVTWGQQISFTAVADSVQQRLVLFSPDGVPLRAIVTVAFREYRTLEEQLNELNLQSVDRTRRVALRRGDSLALIAAREYGDPRLWRVIADRNPRAAANPRRLRPGDVLVLPPVETTGRRR